MKRTGKYAYVDGIPCIVDWGVSRASNAARYQASCVPDASGAVEGNINETGAMSGLGYLPPMPGEDDISFIGVASAKAGEIVNYEGDILISETRINIPIAGGGPINWQCSFGVQGELEKTTVTAYVDDTRNPAPSAKNGKLQMEATIDSDTFVDIADTYGEVQNITLVFRRGMSDIVEDGLTYRETGNLEADLSFDVVTDDREIAMYAVNAIKNVRVYVTDTLFYYLDAILFQNQSNFQVSRTNNALLGYSVNGIWTAMRQRDPAALGQILLPGGDVFYGEASA